MDRQEIEALLARYRSGDASEKDMAFLESWYLSRMRGGGFAMEESDRAADAELAWEHIVVGIGGEAPEVRLAKVKRLWMRWVAAASMVLVLGAGLIFYRRAGDGTGQVAWEKVDRVILPGSNKAVLTLSGGKRIALDDAGMGALADEAGVEVVKDAGGQLVYRALGKGGALGTGYNSVETPKGGQYTVVLSDGSKVYLNAMSSLRYPLWFSGSERVVELTGEGYFEVARDSARPFRVKSSGQVVEVLGTHFDVNGYGDDGVVRTTLLEGSVRVIAGGVARVIAPGEQAGLARDGMLSVKKVDVEPFVAWRSDKFMFDRMGIREVMKMVERWYDVEVVYEGEVTSERFVGSVSRFDKISRVLTTLERTGGVKFRVEGRKVFVSKPYHF